MSFGSGRNLYLYLFLLAALFERIKMYIIKDGARGIIGQLLELTTDRHEASRGLFAIAELVVAYCCNSHKHFNKHR